MRSKISFEDVNDDNLDNLAIKLSIDNFETFPRWIQQQLTNFLLHLTSLIGAHTDINYHAIDKTERGCTLISLHGNVADNSKSTLEVVQNRLDAAIDYLKSIDFIKQQTGIIRIVNALIHHGFDLNNLVKVGVVNTRSKNFYIQPAIIPLQHPVDYHRITVKKLKLNGDTISFIKDKCAENYGVFVNLSMTFADMGMSYNALHLFEHLMMRCFRDLPMRDLEDSNGATYPNGLCYVYSAHKTFESVQLYLHNALKVMHEIRQKGYWNEDKHRQDILFETKRTVSETRYSRTLVDFGRSDLNAFREGYDTNIFEYWSNLPFDIVVTGPKVSEKILKMDYIKKLSDKYPRNDRIFRPKNIKHRIIPIDVLMSKEFTQTLTQKASQKQIHDVFIEPFYDAMKNEHTILEDGMVDFGKYGYLYGLDCYLMCLKESLIQYNTFLMPIVFLNRYFSSEELEAMLNKANTPVLANNYITNKYFMTK